jgi:hypothetical protein
MTDKLASSQIGFRIVGNTKVYFNIGMAVSSKGDFNGDGCNDLVVSALLLSGQGIVFLINGNTVLKERNEDFFLDNLNDRTGMKVLGPLSTFTGLSLSFVNDMNNDGYHDLVIGSISYQGNKQVSYVIYGRNTSSTAPAPAPAPASSLYLTSLNSEDGFTIAGSGFLVSNPGDMNDDGMNDLMLTSFSDWSGKSNAYLLSFPLNVSSSPSFVPSSMPTSPPPTSSPSFLPLPSSLPTNSPSVAAVIPSSTRPTMINFTSFSPVSSLSPSPAKTRKPTILPSTRSPSFFPSLRPRSLSPMSFTPSVSPSVSPSVKPSRSPTVTPSINRNPSSSPSSFPTINEKLPASVISLSLPGFYDLTSNLVNSSSNTSSTSSSASKQVILIEGSGHFILKGRKKDGSGERIFKIIPASSVSFSQTSTIRRLSESEEAIIDIEDFDSRHDKLDFSSYSFIHGLNELSYGFNPLSFFPNDYTTVHLLSHRTLETFSEERNFLFAVFSPSSSVSTSIALSTNFDLSLILSLVMLGMCGLITAVSVCMHKRTEERKRKKEKEKDEADGKNNQVLCDASTSHPHSFPLLVQPDLECPPLNTVENSHNKTASPFPVLSSRSSSSRFPLSEEVDDDEYGSQGMEDSGSWELSYLSSNSEHQQFTTSVGSNARRYDLQETSENSSSSDDDDEDDEDDDGDDDNDKHSLESWESMSFSKFDDV